MEQHHHNSDLGLPMPGFDSTQTSGQSSQFPTGGEVGESAPLREAANSASKIIPDTDNPLTVEAVMEKLNINFLVGAGDEIAGDIKIQEGKSIVVRGRVKGSIDCKGFVLIMKEGRVDGAIKAGQLWVEGEVGPLGQDNGKIDVGTLHISKGAKVYADCIYDQISIATPNRGLKGRLEARSTITNG